jgi:hypothetical protein
VRADHPGHHQLAVKIDHLFVIAWLKLAALRDCAICDSQVGASYRWRIEGHYLS